MTPQTATPPAHGTELELEGDAANYAIATYADELHLYGVDVARAQVEVVQRGNQIWLRVPALDVESKPFGWMYVSHLAAESEVRYEQETTGAAEPIFGLSSITAATRMVVLVVGVSDYLILRAACIPFNNPDRRDDIAVVAVPRSEMLNQAVAAIDTHPLLSPVSPGAAVQLCVIPDCEVEVINKRAEPAESLTAAIKAAARWRTANVLIALPRANRDAHDLHIAHWQRLEGDLIETLNATGGQVVLTSSNSQSVVSPLVPLGEQPKERHLNFCVQRAAEWETHFDAWHNYLADQQAGIHNFKPDAEPMTAAQRAELDSGYDEADWLDN